MGSYNFGLSLSSCRCSCWGWFPTRYPHTTAAQPRCPPIAPQAGVSSWIATFFSQRSAWPPSTRSSTRGSICSSGRSSSASSASWLTQCPTAPSRNRKGPRQPWMSSISRSKTASTLRKQVKSTFDSSLTLKLGRMDTLLSWMGFLKNKGGNIYVRTMGEEVKVLRRSGPTLLWVYFLFSLSTNSILKSVNQHKDAWPCRLLHLAAAWWAGIDP